MAQANNQRGMQTNSSSKSDLVSKFISTRDRIALVAITTSKVTTLLWQGTGKNKSEISVAVDNSSSSYTSRNQPQGMRKGPCNLQGMKMLLPQAALESVYSSPHTTLIPLFLCQIWWRLCIFNIKIGLLCQLQLYPTCRRIPEVSFSSKYNHCLKVTWHYWVCN